MSENVLYILEFVVLICLKKNCKYKWAALCFHWHHDHFSMETKIISIRKIVSFCNENKSLSYTVLFFVVTNILAMFSTKFEAPCVSCTVTRTLSEFGGCSYDAVPFTFNSFKVMVCCFLSAVVLQFQFLKKGNSSSRCVWTHMNARRFFMARNLCATYLGSHTRWGLEKRHSPVAAEQWSAFSARVNLWSVAGVRLFGKWKFPFSLCFPVLLNFGRKLLNAC